MLNKLHAFVFGDWRDKSTAVAGTFDAPGVYVMAARAHGLKGLLGGRHSYIVHVSGGGEHTVFEITDRETLGYQGATEFKSYKTNPGFDEPVLYRVLRNGYQEWFGAQPYVVYHTQVWPELVDLDALFELYPHKNDQFKLFYLNCNTFVSWGVYLARMMGIDACFPKTFGTKSDAYWEKFYV